jgi:hypothetical protein
VRFPAEHPLTIVKLDPVGRVVARYPGTIHPAALGWIAIVADWQLGTVEVGPLRFEPGDRLIEYFSFVEPINAFALFAPACPAYLVERTLFWRDLYIDIIGAPDGQITVLDEEELEESQLSQRDPEGYACILAARDRLLTALRTRAYPFHLYG